MGFPRTLFLTAGAVCGALLLTTFAASARTICRPDGICFNTSGQPIYPDQQPAYRGGFADDGYPYHRRHRRHYSYTHY